MSQRLLSTIVGQVTSNASVTIDSPPRRIYHKKTTTTTTSKRDYLRKREFNTSPSTWTCSTRSNSEGQLLKYNQALSRKYLRKNKKVRNRAPRLPIHVFSTIYNTIIIFNTLLNFQTALNFVWISFKNFWILKSLKAFVHNLMCLRCFIYNT